MRRAFIILMLLAIYFEVQAQKVETDSSLAIYKERVMQKPKHKYQYHKKKYVKRISQNKTTADIDFEAIYVLKSYGRKVNDTTYSFTRFFPTGEVFVSYGYYNEPSDVEANDLSYGHWEMYTIKNNGDIVMETPAYGDYVKWYYYFMKAMPKGIETYKYRLGRLVINSHPRFHQFEYRKSVKLYNYNINWK